MSDDYTTYMRLNLLQVKERLLKHLEQQMMQVVVRLASYVKSNFGPSNLGGMNPSQPGFSPNIGLGTLRNSITHKVDRRKDEVVGIYGVRIGPATPYAKRLELGFYGTDSSGKTISQAPRPFLIPALKVNRSKIIKWLKG